MARHAAPGPHHRAPVRSRIRSVSDTVALLVTAHPLRARQAALAALAVAVVALTAWGVFLGATAANATPSRVPATDRIEEDDPRFDCRIHGNERCGTTMTDPVTGAPIAVVIAYREGLPVAVYLD